MFVTSLERLSKRVDETSGLHREGVGLRKKLPERARGGNPGAGKKTGMSRCSKQKNGQVL